MLQQFAPQHMMSGSFQHLVNFCTCQEESPMPASHRVALLLLTLVFVGCGSKNPAQVSGSVTLDDKPLTSGTVTFHPVGGKGAIAYAQIDGQGNYELTTGASEGLAAGSYVATVVAFETLPPASPTAEPELKRLTPAKYEAMGTSDLKVEVKAGANNLPLALKSR
jgi:hypothetical protein